MGVASNLFSPLGGTSSKREHHVLSFFFFQLILLKGSAVAPAVEVFLTPKKYMHVFSHILQQSEVHMTVQSILTGPEKYIPILNCLYIEQLNECMNKCNKCLLVCQYYCAA